MGLSSSSVRKLGFIAEMHNIEYRAQAIQTQIINLATSKDSAYEEYNRALEAKNFEVAFFNGPTTSFKDASFNNLCTYNPERARDYALIDTRTDKMLVSQEMFDAYESFGNDKYTFAYAMLGLDTNFGWGYNNTQAGAIGVGTNEQGNDWDYSVDDNFENPYNDLPMTEVELCAFERYRKSHSDGKTDELLAAYEKYSNEDDPSKRDELLKEFRDKLYEKCASEIFDLMNVDKNAAGRNNQRIDDYMDFERYGTCSQTFEGATWNDFKAEFDYYTRMWEAINQAGGCQVIEPQYLYGKESREYIEGMVNAGLIVIQENDTFKGWQDTSIATSTNGNYLREVEDEEGLEKAKAKYEHELDIINRKETSLQKELKECETRRSAIEKALETAEKVGQDNIENRLNVFN